jgi:hypothetical protein
MVWLLHRLDALDSWLNARFRAERGRCLEGVQHLQPLLASPHGTFCDGAMPFIDKLLGPWNDGDGDGDGDGDVGDDGYMMAVMLSADARARCLRRRSRIGRFLCHA